MEFFKSSTLIFGSGLNALLGLLVYLKAPKRHANMLFFIASIAVAEWSLGNVAFIYVKDLDHALLIAQIFYIGPLVATYAYFLMAIAFPNREVPRKIITLASILVSTISATIIFSPEVLFKSVFFDKFGEASISLNVLPYAIYSANIVIPIASAVVILARKSRSLPPVHAQQAKLLSYGMLLGSLVGTYFNLILPWFSDYSSVWIGPNAVLLLFTFAAYGTLKHRLFVIRHNLLRGLADRVINVLALLIYGALIYYFGSHLAHSGNSSATMVTFYAVAAVLYTQYAKFISRVLSNLFSGTTYAASLSSMVANILTSQKSHADAMKAIAELLVSVSGITLVVINVKNKNYVYPHEAISTDEISKLSQFQGSSPIVIYSDVTDDSINFISDKYLLSQAIVLSTDFQQLGVLIIGDKRSGLSYGSNELAELNLVANVISLATSYFDYIDEITSFANTLKVKVADATRKEKLVNHKLRQINRAKDDMISMVSHQLIPQLTAVNGFIGLAREAPDQSEELLELSLTALHRMTSLTQDMLIGARIQTGELKLIKSKTNVKEVVLSEIGNLKYSAEKHDVTVSFECIDPVYLELDQAKFQEAIFNIIDNAIQYSPKKSTVVVILSQEKLSVIDQGIGIPIKELNQLFKKFFRGSNARAFRPNGSGVGLFVAAKILKCHGFRISVNSKEGQGTKVDIALK